MSITFNDFYPSQSQIPGGESACTMICIIACVALEKLKRDVDIFNIDWSHIVNQGARLHALWRAKNLRSSNEARSYVTIYEALEFSKPMKDVIDRHFDLDEIGGVTVLHDHRAEPGIYYTLEDMTAMLNDGDGFCISTGAYTFLVFQIKGRYILFDSHGVRATYAYHDSTVITTTNRFVLCAELRKTISHTNVETIGSENTTDTFSAVVLRRKKEMENI